MIKRRALFAAVGVLAIAALGLRAAESARRASLDARRASFTREDLSERGRLAYDTLLEAEIVEDTFRSFTFESPPCTDALLALWDEPAELSTCALLALCENGTQAARFYALVGLSGSDPWTFEHAYARYSADDRPLRLLFGCFGLEGTAGELLDEHVSDGACADSWRGVWSRTECTGEGLTRSLRPEFVRN